MLVMLIPVLGIIRPGQSLVANRYGYIACLSWSVLLGGLLYRALQSSKVQRRSEKRRHQPSALSPIGKGALTVAVIVLCLLAPMSWQVTKAWQTEERFLRHFLHIDSNSAFPHYFLGGFLAGQGRYPEAVSHLRQAVKINPKWPIARGQLGSSLLKQNDFDAALNEFQTSLLLNPDAAAFSNLAQVYAIRGEWEHAVQAYRESLKLRPEYAPAHAELAKILSGVGEAEQANVHLQQAIKLDPNLAKPNNVEAASVSVKKLPDPTALKHARLAKVLSREGKTAEAEFHFKVALKLDPNLPPCEVNFCE